MSEPTELFAAESGEYEQRYTACVGYSVEDVVAWIKGEHVAPYVVEWEAVTEDRSVHTGELIGWVLRGHFEAVPGKSTKHDARWDIAPIPLAARTTG